MAADNEEIGKKCAFSGTSLRKAKRYYRDGKYYKNKTAFRDGIKAELAKAQEAK